jgi:hypothetical protein
LDVGLNPFFVLRTTSGEVGAKVIILGTNLVGNVAYHVKVYDRNDSGRGLSFERDNDKD